MIPILDGFLPHLNMIAISQEGLMSHYKGSLLHNYTTTYLGLCKKQICSRHRKPPKTAPVSKFGNMSNVHHTLLDILFYFAYFHCSLLIYFYFIYMTHCSLEGAWKMCPVMCLRDIFLQQKYIYTPKILFCFNTLLFFQ